MAHKAKRIRPGCYEYRGYTIEDMKPHLIGAGHWNITAKGESQACDAANSYADAKATIDLWEDGPELLQAGPLDGIVIYS